MKTKSVQKVSVNDLIRQIGSKSYKIYTKIPNWKPDSKYIGSCFVWYSKENIKGEYFRLNRLYGLLQQVKQCYIIISQDSGVWITHSQNECVQTLHHLENIGNGPNLNLSKDLNELVQTIGSNYYGIYEVVQK